MLENLLNELHPLEIKLLKENIKSSDEEVCIASENQGPASWLQLKQIIEITPQVKTTVYLTELGKKYLEGTPEKKVIDFIKEKQSVKITDIDFLDVEEKKDAIKFLKSYNIIEIQTGGVLVLNEADGGCSGKIEVLQSLIKDANNSLLFDELDELKKSLVNERYKERGKTRNIFDLTKETTYLIKLTEQGKKVWEVVQKKDFSKDEITQLTPEMLKDGSWRTKHFREFSFDIKPRRILIGRPHPYAEFINEVRAKLLSMGFCETRGGIVETEFWNLDALFMPQSHPARDVHGVYFVKSPRYAKTIKEEEKFINNVSKVHKNGGETGSKGWGYEFDNQQTKRLILRSQGTVMSARALAEHPEPPGKYFTIARCFRPDDVDSTHAPDFLQLDGIVLSESINFRSLLGLLKLFASELACAKEVKFTPSYFPFTEPSASLYAKHPTLGWVELGGAGIFRPEVTAPLGVKVPVIAWGLGLDRMAMMALKINDIRDFFSRDLETMRYVNT
ncbi:MAG: phenylalanine--tRNA ligase subunit alpha [bacterium]|nr:phenylalanine--tRNA ligase subunit alpha [bacterium]